ncbi:MAG: hypothetical protein ACSHYB_09835 [Roseibacillus sp.]
MPSLLPNKFGTPTKRRTLLALLPLLGNLLVTAHAADQALDFTEVSRGPGKDWKKMSTRTLSALPSIEPDKNLTEFGGFPTNKPKPTGFFRATFRNNRWWLADPQGHPYLHRGVTSIKETRTKAAAAALQKKFGNIEGWAKGTADLLKSHHFNAIGPWSDDETLKPSQVGLAYTKLWNFMSSYGKKRGGTYQKSGHRGYPNDCPFIFDPDFATFCDQHAEQLADLKDDPWLLGHFTDNELPWNIQMLDRYLTLPKNDHGYLAAKAWLEERKGTNALAKKWHDEDRLAFVGHAADTYFSIVSTAIRKHDPNHLVLGSRFHGSALRLPSLFEAAGRHLDIISVNYYHRWTPEQNRMRNWSQAAKKPILITEWYAKAEDSGMANTSGAGWLVKTQEDRGAFYQNFTLGLLESKVCVGWHWFRYSDNDPAQKGADPSNLDANKGIVTSHYEPYQPLLKAMKKINERSYGIALHFDQTETPPEAE